MNLSHENSRPDGRRIPNVIKQIWERRLPSTPNSLSVHYARDEQIRIDSDEKKVMSPSRYSDHLLDTLGGRLYSLLIKELQTGDNVIDLGCGSGIIGIGLKKIGVKAKVIATDINMHAVSLTQANAQLNNIDPAGFSVQQANMLQIDTDGPIRAIITNPAQLPTRIPLMPDPNGKDIAYWAGRLGRYMIEKTIVQSRERLELDGYLIFTHTSLANVVRTQAFLKEHGFDHEVILNPLLLELRPFYDIPYIISLGEDLSQEGSGKRWEYVYVIKAQLKDKGKAAENEIDKSF